MSPAVRAGFLTVLAGTVFGFLILGVGGRLAMHAIARLTGGTGGFTLGGTATVLFLGTASGAGAGLVLFTARLFLRRWPPLPTIVFWAAVLAYTLPKLDLRDPLELGLFLPVAILFGVLLQYMTSQIPLRRQL